MKQRTYRPTPIERCHGIQANGAWAGSSPQTSAAVRKPAHWAPLRKQRTYQPQGWPTLIFENSIVGLEQPLFARPLNRPKAMAKSNYRVNAYFLATSRERQPRPAHCQKPQELENAPAAGITRRPDPAFTKTASLYSEAIAVASSRCRAAYLVMPTMVNTF